MSEAAGLLAETHPDPVRLALVLGSGLGGLADEIEDAHRFASRDLPGFPAAGVSGHEGALTLGRLAGVSVAALSGRAHYYERGDAAAMRAPIETFRALGAETLLLTNAAGSTREEIAPGALMAIRDHINFSGRDPLIGATGDERFVNMVGAYDPALRARLAAAAKTAGVDLAEGVYAWVSGPAFETPAEIAAIRTLGADAVGMSTAPECVIARHVGLKVAAVSVITNYAAGMTGAALSHDETKAEAGRAQTRFRALIRAFAGSFADD